MTISPRVTGCMAIWTAGLLIGSAQAAAPQGKFVNPVSLGPGVNTESIEWGPVVSADGLTLHYFSDRELGFGGNDIYSSTRASTADLFGTPINLGPSINTANNDRMGSISTDGLTLYFSSDRSGGVGDQDLYQATRASTADPFGNVTHFNTGLNTISDDSGSRISADGLTLYFHSERTGGQGSFDLYMTKRDTTDDPFGPPDPLDQVNSIYAEIRPTISADGLTLLFSDNVDSPNRPGGQGDMDIWVTTRETIAEPFGPPLNLNDLWPGSAINTPSVEASPYLSPDWPAVGSKLYFVTDRSRNGDVWEVTWVPEPSSFALAALGSLGALLCAWRQRLCRH